MEAYIKGEGSLSNICFTYKICNLSILRRWLKQYNANRELNDYDPKREVYMAEAKEKRPWKNVEKLLNTVLNIIEGSTCKYDVSYSQVYSWVKI